MAEILSIVISSGLIAAIVSSSMTYFFNKDLEVDRRTMEKRKELYTQISNQLAFFISTVSEEESDHARDNLLLYYREAQIWGSDEVARSFKELLDVMADKQSLVEERNIKYKSLILAMRQDILSKTTLTAEEIDIRGIVSKA